MEWETESVRRRGGQWSQWKVWNSLHGGCEARQEAWLINVNGTYHSDQVHMVGDAWITGWEGRGVSGRKMGTHCMCTYCVPDNLLGSTTSWDLLLVTFLVATTKHMTRNHLTVKGLV